MTTVLTDILYDSSYLLIIIGNIISLVFGLALMIRPDAVLNFNKNINQPIFTKLETKKQKILIKPEPFFYRNAKLSGMLLFAGALYILYIIISFNFYLLIPYFPTQISASAWSWILHSGQIFFFVCSLFTLIFGLAVFFRPSSLKNLETKANRMFSTHALLSYAGNKVYISNKWLNAHPRTFGFIFSLFALYVLFFHLFEL